MSTFVSRQKNGCLLYALLTTEHGYESPAGIRVLTRSLTLLQVNPKGFVRLLSTDGLFSFLLLGESCKNSLV